MSSRHLRHPEGLALMQYIDGELPKRQVRRMQTHLEACWECRAELDELQTTVTDCVRYRKHVLVPCAPTPPLPWGSLDFATVDAKIAGESVLVRLRTWLAPWQNVPLRWGFSAAMTLALIVAVARHLNETPKVEAAALLQKAVAAAEGHPRSAKRLRITTASHSLIRPAGAPSIRVAAGETEIARWFEAARYDWNDPLSARSYAQWRDALASKTDEVASADPDTYSIKTTTTDSEIVSATLTLRRDTLAPREGRFEFRNHEWVEMTELVDQLSPASMVAGAAGGTPRQPGVPPGPSSRAEAKTGGATEFSNEELQVVAALHQLGADLGDPVEISRDGHEVVVSGTGVAPQRKEQIHAVLDRLPHVVVRFTDPAFPAGTPAPNEPATARDAAAAEKSEYITRLETRLGGRPQFERFSGQLLDWTDSAMSRAYALRRLAQQFSTESEGSMSPEDRRTLRSLGREHLAALQKDLNRIQVTLSPVLNDLGATSGLPQNDFPEHAWQSQTVPLLASARRVETLLAAVLGVTPAASSGDTPSQLLTALSKLTADIEHCQRLLSYD